MPSSFPVRVARSGTLAALRGASRIKARNQHVNAIPADAKAPVVHVVMAVFQPDPDHLAIQIRSLADQAEVHIVLHAVIADLASAPLVQELTEAARLACFLHLPAKKLSAVAAFEHGLEAALLEADEGDFIALCDQDDRWDTDKLCRSLELMRSTPGCHLVHTDARLVDAAGELLAPSIFAEERRDRRTGLRRLLYRNSVTGMTAVMTRETVAHALPFPRQAGAFFYHDLWLALVAAAKGPVAHLAEATVDYRQHGQNAVGVVDRAAGQRFLSKPWLRHRFASFALAVYLAKSVMQRAEEICISKPQAFDRSRLRELRPYLRHRGLGWSFFADAAGYAVRGYGELADHSFSQGAVKAGRMAWAIRRMLQLDLTNRLGEFDAIGYSLAPGAAPRPEGPAAAAARAQDWRSQIDRRRVPGWRPVVDPARQSAWVVLLPTLNPTEIFAGIATALDLGIGLAIRGQRVRFVATDLPLISPDASRSFLADRLPVQNRAAILERIELSCGVTATELHLAPGDRLIATAWWTAHLARDILATPGMTARRFHYLIQDFEPNFYPWGTEFSGAMESYQMPCIPIFNTTLLREYFISQGFTFGGAAPLVFRPSIDIGRYAALERIGTPHKPRIAVYGRPEVPRNMFPLCVEALAGLIDARNLGPENVELISVGMAHDPILLPGGLMLRSLGKLSFDDYQVFLSSVDLGLTLMYSPHPSHLPIEMAAAGVRVVTNGFGPKNLADLTQLITSAEPAPQALTEALIATWDVRMETLPASARQIDLSPLGPTLDETLDRMVAGFALGRAARRVA